MASKISQLTDLMDGAHVMGGSGLAAYHDARKVRAALLKKNLGSRFSAVRQALKNYRVMVSLRDDAIRIYRPDTGQELIVGSKKNPMAYAVQEAYSTGRGSGVIVSEKLRGPYTVTVVVGDKQASRKIKMRAEARAYLRKKLGPLRKAKNPGKALSIISNPDQMGFGHGLVSSSRPGRYLVKGQTTAGKSVGTKYYASIPGAERYAKKLSARKSISVVVLDDNRGEYSGTFVGGRRATGSKSPFLGIGYWEQENPLNRYYLRRGDGAVILYRGRPYMTGSRGTAVAKARTISHKSKSQVNVIRVEPDGYEEAVETIGSSRNPSTNTNAAYDSQRLYDRFHGRPSTKTTVVATKIRSRDHLTELGPLTRIKVHLLTGKRWEKTFDPRRDQVMLCSSPDGLQLYFVDGDQSIDLRSLGMSSREWKKDSMVLGILTEVTYRTEKGFDKFQLTDYYHELGEETGMQPLLIYDTINELLSVSGGQYQVRPEGIVN